MDCDDCPVCHPGTQSPVLSAPRQIVASLYRDLRERSAQAAGLLPCHRNPDEWFNEGTHRAKAECQGVGAGAVPCPLLNLCAVTSLLGKEEHGVWGGMSPRDRRAVHRGRY